MAQRLATATSPYLLQHKDNPVDWWEWGPEAFAEARRRDVPLFVSIGYATCHWCHVMAHESFEEAEVAQALEPFVAVKVDREERPDVDEVYMAACQLFTGRGGWPLTVFLDHDGRPFYAGTYFPKRTRGQMVGLMDLLAEVDKAWRTRREDLLHQAGHILERLHTRPEPGTLGPETAQACVQGILARVDDVHGGLGSAPKFPSCHNILYLLRRHARGPQPEILRMALRQMAAMHRGGIHDHLGGGFHRYSTDPAWLLPHFEKMLYDQAMAAMAGTECWQATGEDVGRAVAQSALDYTLRDLQDPGGAFWSGEDADSEGEEGTFYVWRHEEIEAALGDGARLFCDAYGVHAEGNFHDEATRKKTGANVLHRAVGDAKIAERHGLDVDTVRVRLEEDRRRLKALRDRRPRPQTDDKVLADWNGLMVAALAKAGIAFGRPDYVQAAQDAAAFLRSTMWQDKRMRHSHRAGTTRGESFLSDHAYVLWGAIELYQATSEPAMLQWAQELAAGLERFREGDAWALSETGARMVADRVEAYDGALPAAAGIAAWNLARLSELDGDQRWVQRADEVLTALGGDAARHPAAYVGLHFAVDWIHGSTTQVLAVGPRFHARPAGHRPHVLWLQARQGLADIAPWTGSMVEEGVYVCRGNTCERPVTEPDRVAAAIDGTSQTQG